MASWSNSNLGQLGLKHCEFETPVRFARSEVRSVRLSNHEVRSTRFSSQQEGLSKTDNLAKVTSWLDFDPAVRDRTRESHNSSLQQTLHLPDAAYAQIHDTPGERS